MKNYKSIITLALLGAGLSFGSVADEAMSGAVASTGVIFWDSNASGKFGELRDNNAYLEIAGFHFYPKGDLMGFIRLENFDESDVSNSTFNIQAQRNIGVSDFNFYGQVFSTVETTRDVKAEEISAFLGLSWDKYLEDASYFQAALAVNLTKSSIKAFDTIISDFYGVDGGYVLLALEKPFTVANEKVSFSWFNEAYFGRQNTYMEKDYGFNGEASLNWHLNEKLSVGTTYVYCNDAMGADGFTSAVRVSLSYLL